MITEIGNYRIKPSATRLDWEIFEYREVRPRGKDPYMDWVSLGLYASNYGHALVIVYERMMKDGEEVIGLEEAIKKAKKIQAMLSKETKEVE